jgi:effector-binding domain-containing protein
MIDEPAIIQIMPLPAAVIAITIPRDQIQEAMCPAMEEVIQAAIAQGIGPAGPVFSHHHRMTPGIFDFEVGVPVTAPVSATGRVKPGELPGGSVIRTIYTGPYEGLGDAWGEFMAWIEESGHQTAENLWEAYLTNPAVVTDPASYRTELNCPLA